MMMTDFVCETPGTDTPACKAALGQKSCLQASPGQMDFASNPHPQGQLTRQILGDLYPWAPWDRHSLIPRLFVMNGLGTRLGQTLKKTSMGKLELTW